MIRLAKGSLGIAVSTAIFWYSRDHQDRENLYGVYRSVVNSSRACIILYRAVQDYDKSLSHLEYNSEEYHKARH